MYRIQLQEFEGPLDLLLFFIRRDELDIYDIPIAQITDEFLGYVRLIEEIDLDSVADFIYMAALLIHIKARMLLPRPDLDEEGEPIDPRRELVERLLEYVRYKEAAEALAVQHDRRGELFTRGAASSLKEQLDDEEAEVLVNTTLFDLISALRRVLTEETEEPVFHLERFDFTVPGQRAYVLEQLDLTPKVSFVALARHHRKGFIITTFLAILEMAHDGTVRLTATPRGTDFFVHRGRIEEPGCTNGTMGTTTNG